MPYIGNQHIVGDHINNFKVLDDISSYTETFNGASTNVVSTSDDTIRIPEHRFIHGQRVTYTNGGGGNIGGLTSGQIYFITFHTKNTIKLATNLQNANNNVVVNFSSVGSGTSHTINAAFDGVNTKFKITYEGGKEGRFNNATQLNIAINNVIQRPNLNPITFTEGFAIEDHHKIIFKVAPTVNDIFWGSIIANTIENFDLRDNEVDNFTGDGSATEFTLSTIPANNESVIVTIDGVLQHPSDKNVSRAYTLIDSVIQFTTAPALNAEIQVRHIGFAGASTADVSGFYGRTGNVTLTANDHITTGDITSRNINASGIVTASTFDGAFTGNVVGTSATFTGNLTVGGVLTYEDVTNIDSVGIITAQKDIHVGAGVSAVGVGTFGSLDIGGDIDVDGHTNLDNISIAGVTTVANDTEFIIGSNATATRPLKISHTSSSTRNQFTADYIDFNVIDARFKNFGGAQIAQFFAGYGVNLFYNGGQRVSTTAAGANVYGNLQIESAGPYLQLKDTDHNNDFALHCNNGSLQFVDTTDGYTSRMNINSSGNVSIVKDLDVDGHTNLDNTDIVGILTVTSTTQYGGYKLSNNSVVVGELVGLSGSNDTGALALWSGGSKYVQISSLGNSFLTGGSLGIGTITPNLLLHLHQDNSNATFAHFTNTTTGVNANQGVSFGLDSNEDATIYHYGSKNIRFATGGTEKVRIASNGRVGVGTVVPSAQLETYQSGTTGYLFRAMAGLTVGNRAYDLKPPSSNSLTEPFSWNTPNSHAFQVDGVERLRIDSNGKATFTTPGGDDALLIKGDTYTSVRVQSARNSASDHAMFQMLGSRGTNASPTIIQNNDVVGTINVRAYDGNSYASMADITFEVDGTPGDGDMPGRIEFRTTADGASVPTERVIIDSSGRVMIGNNNASTMFGGADDLVVGNTTGAHGITIITQNNTVGRLLFSDSTSSSAATYQGQINYNHSSEELDLRTYTGGAITFATGNTERARITSGGEVGIRPGGITPTAGDLATGDSQNTPLLHVRGQGTSDTGGVYNLLARFQAGGDSDGSGAMIVLNHDNDRGLAIQGGRRTGNYAHGALKMIDNVGRLSSALLIHGGPGVGIDNMGFYTGNTTTTTERFHLGPTGNFAFYNNGGDNRIERNTTSGGPYLLFHNRGTNTTDSSGVYNLGGISAAGYRDVANPSVVGSMQFVRQPTAGGASSGCDIIFRTGFNGTTSHTGVSERMRISYSGAISSAVTRQALSYTALATPTYWTLSATGTSNQTLDVSSVFGVPDNAKAILVQGWYHITGYSQGAAGQGDHASSHFSEYQPSGSAPWSFTTSSTTTWGQYVMDHDGDASAPSGSSPNPHHYGMWAGQGIVNVNPNGNIYGRCFWGYSGGTHYNQLWCFGYYM